MVEGARSLRLAAVVPLTILACTPGPAPTQPTVSAIPGAVELNGGPPHDIPAGGSGAGTVVFHGQTFGFAISGLGVGGAAVAVLRTSGQVSRLEDIASFPGIYRQAPGSVVTGQSAGGLWLKNEHATIMHLDVPAEGRMPDIDGDAVRIVLTR